MLAGLAFVARVGVGVWAGDRFPAAADGFYYDTLARRLAQGHGYTWLWPDGAVTNVAHYPVGYPAMLAASYLALGAGPVAAMLLNALFGAAMTFAVHSLVARASARGATASALVVALHPALVAYTPAVMTESVAAALLTVAAALARGPRRAWDGTSAPRAGWSTPGAWCAAGALLGIATLVRPQSLVFAPVLGALAPDASSAWAARARAALVVTAVALGVCAPWTARNCVAMRECALVSVNGGWNLLIGAQTTDGAWHPADVPEECRTVWDEAQKDVCFGRAARRTIVAAPLAWLARAPAKIAVTLDYFGAAPWYLHESNARVVDERAKLRLAEVETAASVLVLLAALAGVAFASGPRRRVRLVVAGAGVALGAATLHPSVTYLALAGAILAFGPRTLARGPVVLPFTAVVILGTAAVHAVFFGAGRYGLVVVPFVAAVAGLFVAPGTSLRDPEEGATPPGPTSRRRSPVFDS